MKNNRMLTMLMSVVVSGMLTLTALATDPTVDGEFTTNEYTESQPGSWSTCWSYTAANGALYIFNDWDNPDSNYDPLTDNDYNVFTWSGVANWRLMVLANGTGKLQKYNGSYWVDQGGSTVASNYTTTPDHPLVDYPVWELVIPAAQLETTQAVNPSDPKNGGDSGNPNCPSGWNTVALGFGTAPAMSP